MGRGIKGLDGLTDLRDFIDYLLNQYPIFVSQVEKLFEPFVNCKYQPIKS